MSHILYYSNYCKHSQKIIKALSKKNLDDKVHFISIDNREALDNKIYIVLEQGKKLLLPPTIKSVPAIYDLNNHTTEFGANILRIIDLLDKPVSPLEEPDPFTFMSGDIISDTYSFLDLKSEEMLAKGNGGIKQMHNYVGIDSIIKINTPDEDYIPDKVGGNDLEKYQRERSQMLHEIAKQQGSNNPNRPNVSPPGEYANY